LSARTVGSGDSSVAFAPGLSPAPIATFLKAPLRSRTVGFPESGSDLGSARHLSEACLPVKSEAKTLVRIHPSSSWFACSLATTQGRPAPRGKLDRRSRPCPRLVGGGWTGGPAMSSTVPHLWPPSAQGSFAHPGCYPESGRPRRSPGRALPLRHRSYEPMRQTKTLQAPRVPPCALGPCRLLPAPAGRWPFPTLSLRPLCRCSDPYPATPLGCTYPLLHRGQRSHPTGNGFDARIYPHVAASAGSRISRLQSFVYLRAPTLARPSDCSDHSTESHWAAGPFTPRRTRSVTRSELWRRFMSDTDN
jgi:hypothetical protein